MSPRMTVLVLALFVFSGGTAGELSAQEADQGAARWEVTGIPAGGTLFTKGSRDTDEADFTNYALGGSLTYNFNQRWGVEGEVGIGLGIDQRLTFRRRPSIGDASVPDTLSYQGNVVFYPVRNDRRFVPYLTAGAGGLTLFKEESVGLDGDETFLVGNLGGGVKWYFGRWGVRGDYRFFAVDGKSDAPAFFGRDARYGHRVYGALIFGFGR